MSPTPMPYPIKLSLKTEIVPVFFVLASVVLSFYFYARFPEVVTTHWNFAGQPDGYGSRALGAFAIPALLVVMYALFLILPALDPKSERYAAFQNAYHLIKDSIIAVLFAVYAIAGYYNIGYPVKIGVLTPLLVGVLLIIIGNVMGKVKNNWFVGVRTPWTLSSENVWNKTNRLGGRLMVLFGLLMILSPFLPKTLALALFILGIIALVLGTLVYSYVLYRKEQHNTPSIIK